MLIEKVRQVPLEPVQEALALTGEEALVRSRMRAEEGRIALRAFFPRSGKDSTDGAEARNALDPIRHLSGEAGGTDQVVDALVLEKPTDDYGETGNILIIARGVALYGPPVAEIVPIEEAMTGLAELAEDE